MFSVIISIIWLIFLFIKATTKEILISAVNDQAIFNEKNGDIWGNFTEKNAVKVYQSVKFYDYKSFKDGKYQIWETPSSKSREHHIIKDQVFSDEGIKVDYIKDTIRTVPVTEKDFEARIPNFLGYFFWHQVQNLPQLDRSWMALSNLVSKFVENQFFKKQIVIGVLHDNLGFTDYDFVKGNILDGLHLDEKKKKHIFEDDFYGLNSKYGIFRWIEFMDVENLKVDKIEKRQNSISNYFDIKHTNTLIIFKKIKKYYLESETLLKTVFECKNYCESYDLLKIQWSTSALSLKLLQKDTVADDDMVFGYLEYKKFYKEKYMTEPEFKDCEISLEQAQSLLSINVEELAPSQKWDTLIHKSNLKDILEIGIEYDIYKDLKIWKKIVKRFKLKSNNQAIVIYEYIKYMGNEFLTMESIGGNMEITAFSNIFAEYYKIYFENAVDFVNKEVVSEGFKNYFIKNNLNCQKVFVSSLPVYDEEDVKTFCEKFLDSTFGLILFNNCEVKKEEFAELDQVDFFSICYDHSKNENSYYSHKNKYFKELKSIYKIDSDFNIENLVIKQFVNSTLTQTENIYLNNKYKKSNSLKNWDSSIFKFEFEMNIFAKSLNQEEALNEYTLRRFKDILNENKLLNGIVLNRAIILNRRGEIDYFTKKFKIKDSKFFEKFIKNFLKNVIGGDFANITQKDIKYGITSEFLREMSEKKILKGGDPSIPYFFQPIKPYEKASLQKFTGKDNFKKTDRYNLINNKNYATSNPVPYFNGNKTEFLYNNPWKHQIRILGNEVLCPVFRESDDYDKPEKVHYKGDKRNFIYFYLEPLARHLRLDYVSEEPKNYKGIYGQTYKVNETEYEINEKNDVYFQNLYKGVFNLTSVFNAPIFMTREHFYNVDKTIKEKIEMFDECGIPIVEKETDNFFIQLEKFSKTAMVINANFQANMRIEKNEIFFPEKDDYNRLLPIFSLLTLNDMDEEAMDNILGPLSLVYYILRNYYTIMFLLFLFFVLSSLGCLYGLYRMKKKEELRDTSLFKDKEKLLDLE